MLVRFGPYAFNDYIGELIKLQLTGSVAEYQIQFETLLSKTKGIPRDQLTSYFVSGLKEYKRTVFNQKSPKLSTKQSHMQRSMSSVWNPGRRGTNYQREGCIITPLLTMRTKILVKQDRVGKVPETWTRH